MPKKDEDKVRLIKTTIRLQKTLWDDVRIMAIQGDMTVERVVDLALKAGLPEVARIVLAETKRAKGGAR